MRGRGGEGGWQGEMVRGRQREMGTEGREEAGPEGEGGGGGRLTMRARQVEGKQMQQVMSPCSGQAGKPPRPHNFKKQAAHAPPPHGIHSGDPSLHTPSLPSLHTYP